MPSSFEDFLKNKNQSEKPIDWVSRKNQWLGSIDSLYTKINKWLGPFIKQSLIKVDTKKTFMYEQYIGNYEALQLNIFIGNDVIVLIPRGTFILGSYGRIDMKGPKGEKLLIESKWDEWKFVTNSNKRELWDLNEVSFQSAIQDLING